MKLHVVNGKMAEDRLIEEKFEYDSRSKADLIKLIKLNSTCLNFYYHFEIPQLS